jgi:hypothetical protein
MKLIALSAIILISSALTAQTAATVPITLDHNRVIIDVRLPMPDGTTRRVRAWVDNGDPDMWVTGDLADKLGLQLSGDITGSAAAQIQTTTVPQEIHVGSITLHASELKEGKALLNRDAIAPGMSAEINIPSTLLRHYDVLIDYANREFTIGLPGSLHFTGTTVPAQINPDNGLIQVASEIEGSKNNLALDFGASFTLLSNDLLSQLEKAHSDWPRMTGAVAAANMWGSEEEVHANLLRIPELKVGTVTLTHLAAEGISKDTIDFFQKRAGVPTAGLVGANAFLPFRIGLDYAHSTIYFDPSSLKPSPDLDVVGLTLRPQNDGKYIVAGVAQVNGKPAVPDAKPGDVLVKIDNIDTAGGTMGQAWSLLGGSPGDVRELLLSRDGKQITLKATVQHFLEEPPNGKSKKKKQGKK